MLPNYRELSHAVWYIVNFLQKTNWLRHRSHAHTHTHRHTVWHCKWPIYAFHMSKREMHKILHFKCTNDALCHLPHLLDWEILHLNAIFLSLCVCPCFYLSRSLSLFLLTLFFCFKLIGPKLQSIKLCLYFGNLLKWCSGTSEINLQMESFA